MFRLIVNKQAFKALSSHLYHSCRLIGTTPRRNVESDSYHDNGHHYDRSSGSGGSASHPDIVPKGFYQPDKDVSNIKLKLEHLETRLSETRADIKDLSNKMEQGFDRTDRKFDKTDSKIDRIFYGVITSLVGFVLKAGFDYYQAAKK
ncbi:hypothetical protein HOY82DRAFT_521761 [Tuber indicum]|nr:hypothetical protein HOY82DRAFT_521761 [Tuber indicum]